MKKFVLVIISLFCSLGFSAASQKEFSMLVEERHSGYFYDPMKLVSSEQILQLANAARLSPS